MPVLKFLRDRSPRIKKERVVPSEKPAAKKLGFWQFRAKKTVRLAEKKEAIKTVIMEIAGLSQKRDSLIERQIIGSGQGSVARAGAAGIAFNTPNILAVQKEINSHIEALMKIGKIKKLSQQKIKQLIEQTTGLECKIYNLGFSGSSRFKNSLGSLAKAGYPDLGIKLIRRQAAQMPTERPRRRAA